MWDAHRHAERYNAHVSRGALLRVSFHQRRDAAARTNGEYFAGILVTPLNSRVDDFLVVFSSF